MNYFFMFAQKGASLSTMKTIEIKEGVLGLIMSGDERVEKRRKREPHFRSLETNAKKYSRGV